MGLAAGVCCLMLLSCAELRADELITTGGEHLVGQVVAETAGYVEFQSNALGLVRLDRSLIARLERGTPPEQAPVAAAPTAPAASGAAAAENTPPASCADRAQPGGAVPTPDEAAAEDVAQLDQTILRFNPLRGWKTSLRLGLLSRRGQDSDTAIDLAYRSEKTVPLRNREYLLEVRYYRKDKVHLDNSWTISDNNLVGEFRARWNFRARWFIQSNTRYYREPLVNLLNEATQTGGLGYWLLAGDRVRLSFGPAAGVQYTEYTTQSGWHFVAGFYQDLRWQLLKTFKVREEVYYFQDPWNPANHAVRLNVEATQSLSRVVSLGFAYEYAFESEVGGIVNQNQQRIGLNLGLHF